MSATVERNLTGARLSEAPRCEARAAYLGLNTTPTDERPRWLEDAFDRGVPVGEIWGLVQGARLRAQGHEVSLEHAIPWGPPERNWHGHVDVADMTDAICDEAYHSNTLEFREVKALQVAHYVDLLTLQTGREWRGVITAVNTADGDRTGGMAFRRFPVDMDGLRDKVREMRARIIASVEDGFVYPALKVSDTPQHPECQACVFKSLCHAGYKPPEPDEVVGLEEDFKALRILESDKKHAEAKVDSTSELIRAKRESLRQYLQPGIPVTSGDTTIKIVPIRGRVTVGLDDFVKAGHSIPPELAAFVKVGDGHERWYVSEVEA